MWYLGSLFILIVFLLASAMVGGAVCKLLPWRIRPHATVAFAPIFGLAVFMLMATAVAWLGKGFRPWVCCPLTILLVALSVWINYNPKSIGQVAVRVAGFSFIGSLGWLFSIIRFGAYDAYNDTFGYLVQAQWLQTHSFRKLALISGEYPAFSQVFTFQLGGLRVAGSFLYSWIQATFGIDWSYIAYPAAVLIPLCASAIALAGVAFFLVRKSRAICILGGLAVGTTLNGECSGSEFGFFHQTYGIAFGFAFMSLLGMYFVHIGRYPKYAVWRVLPFALLLAAVLYAYPEISPFVVFGGFTWGCKPKTSEFIGRVRKGRIYCKLTQARMASRSMGCRLSLKA